MKSLRDMVISFLPAEETTEERVAHLREQLMRVASIRTMFHSKGWEEFAETLMTEAEATVDEIVERAGDPSNRHVLAELKAYKRCLEYIADLHNTIETHSEEAVSEIEKKLTYLQQG